MKKIITLILILSMMSVFAACGKGESKPSNENVGVTANTTENTSAFIDGTQSNTNESNTGRESLPAETSAAISSDVDVEKIKSDLIAEEVNCFYLNNQATYLGIDSIEILRRKTDAEYDEVHIAAVFSNMYYKVDAAYVLYYSYYDVGGWCLDDCSLSGYQSKAIDNPVSDSDFVEFMQDHFSSCTITNRTQNTDSTGIYTDIVDFTATLDFPYLTVDFSGWYQMQFYDDSWKDTFDFWVDNYDWSAFEDTFRYRDMSINMGAGFYSADVKISMSDIEQISEEKLRVTYSASVYLFDKTGGYIDTDEKIAEKTKEIKVRYKSATILGREVDIPYKASYIKLPWDGTFAVMLDRDAGVEATDDTAYDYTFASFYREVSDEELQDAIDKLESLNP